ncbi:MAG: LysM peptidoglycan-binding domain-containing protein [Chloroflexi bacterium]|nr:LysM peptidoglycan-binding domain-containing protein [Chloroflexota bacterium]
MRTYTRYVRWVAAGLILPLVLTGCFRSAGGSLEPTPSSDNGTPVAQNTPLPPPPTDTPEPEATEEAAPLPTAEELTEEVELLPTATEDEFAQPTATLQLDEPTATDAGAFAPTGPTATSTVPTVIAMAPTFTPETPPTQVIQAAPPTIAPTETPTETPTQEAVLFPTVTPPGPPTVPPTFTPAAQVQQQVMPGGPTPTFTSVVFPTLAPSPTYTQFAPPGAQQPGEAVPLGERPAETPPPDVVDGQGGPVPTETPMEIAQVATLSPNQITATALVFGATATAAAAQGTILPPLGQPTLDPGQAPAAQPTTDPFQQPAPIATAQPTVGAAGQVCGEHLISPGENLFRIAQRYNVTVQQMAQANNIVNPDLILAGDTLTVPCPVPGTTTTTTTTTGTGVVAAPGTYIVEPGDNLYRISLRYGVSMAALMQANGMTPSTINMIYAGQQLVIPGGGAVQTGVTAAPTAAPIPTVTPDLGQQPQAVPAG